MRTIALILASCLFALPAVAAPTGCFPPNDLWQQDGLHEGPSMSEAQFNQIIDTSAAVYAPIVKAQGGTLVIDKKWPDSTVNAYAQKQGSIWNVTMFGGLARRPETTADGFALVVCHELGHHLAGFPFYTESDMASEGQSDYFSTQACAKKIWANKATENAKAAAGAPIGYKNWCKARGGDANLCVRILMAGDSLATLLGALNQEGKPRYNTPDQFVSTRIYEGHPAAQCRLDTYLAGLVCNVAFPDSYRPGLAADGIGYNTLAAAKQALAVSCTNRPKCWYAQPIK